MKNFLTCICTVYLFTLFGEIKTVFSIQETASHAENWTENTLVVFDIDDTLTRLSDPLVDLRGIKMHHSSLLHNFLQEHPIDIATLALAIPLITTSSELLEKETPVFIQALQERNIKTVALTAVISGKVANMDMEDRRMSELLRVGIDFSHSFKTVGDLVFTSLNKGALGRHPIHKQGLLLTNEINKGDVLVAFLKSIEWVPEEIIFFDDRLDNLQNVKDALYSYNPTISFLGFHIRLIENLPHERMEETLIIEKWTSILNQAKQELL